ncbi:AAA-like domain-containing protein [Okeania sp. KiyG1]|uniref:AAA-like domain-containing protein n=1 Tax=Okeania sp. KiyG1 TaxID=2720165 RepID=UPI0019239EB6|nr:AAA-like domain-containing protein [Okeania sp. KiyG1]
MFIYYPLQREALNHNISVNQSVPFIRVKAAKGMGKSSLLDRISHFLEKEKKEVVARIDLATDAFGDDTLNDSEKLFRRFTEEVFKN